MAKKSTKKPVKRKEAEAVEVEPGAWGRFEHAVDAAVKSGPKHRISPKPQKAKAMSAKRQLSKPPRKGSL